MVKKYNKTKKIKTFLIIDGGKLKKKSINRVDNSQFNKNKSKKNKQKKGRINKTIKRIKGGYNTRYINQAYGPWGNIPVKPDSSYYIHENLKSADPPPKALTQYSGTNRPGNNFNINKGVYNYKTNGFNKGPFRIKVTKGGRKKLKGGNNTESEYGVKSPVNGFGQENILSANLTSTALQTEEQSKYDSEHTLDVPETPENATVL